jgi:hypothetical protein
MKPLFHPKVTNPSLHDRLIVERGSSLALGAWEGIRAWCHLGNYFCACGKNV